MKRTAVLLLCALVVIACAQDLATYTETRTRVQADLEDVRQLFRSVGMAYDAAHGAVPPKITNVQYAPWRTFALRYQQEILRIGSEVSGARVRESLTAVWPDILALKADLLRLQTQLDVALQGGR